MPGTAAEEGSLQQVYLFAGNWFNSSELPVLPTWSHAERQQLQQGAVVQPADQPAAAEPTHHAAAAAAAAAAQQKAVPASPAEAWDAGSIQLWLQQLAQQQTASADVGFVNLYGQEFLGCLPELAASDDGSGHNIPASMQPYIAALEASAAARAAAAGAGPALS
jgi:hypothetical protein